MYNITLHIFYGTPDYHYQVFFQHDFRLIFLTEFIYYSLISLTHAVFFETPKDILNWSLQGTMGLCNIFVKIIFLTHERGQIRWQNRARKNPRNWSTVQLTFRWAHRCTSPTIRETTRDISQYITSRATCTYWIITSHQPWIKCRTHSMRVVCHLHGRRVGWHRLEGLNKGANRRIKRKQNMWNGDREIRAQS